LVSKVAVVTGASGDIGSQLCLMLAGHGVDVILVDRDEDKSIAFSKILNAQFPGRLRGALTGDLGSHRDKVRMATEILLLCPKIDYLFNNAGVLSETLQFSKNGNELEFEINALAPLEMIDLLRDGLQAAGGGTVVNTTAGLAISVKSLDLDDLIAPKSFAKLFGPYIKSKQALNVITVALSRELQGSGIRVVAVDPGPNQTRLTRGGGTPLWMRLFYMFLPKPGKGAQKIFDGAFGERWRERTGIVLSNGKECALPDNLVEASFAQGFLEVCRRRLAAAHGM